MGSDNRNYIGLEVQNHYEKSIFLNFPYFEIQDSTEKLAIIKDSAYRSPVQTGELKSGDSRTILVDPTEIEINIDKLGIAIFPDKIGRKFKGSMEDILETIKIWHLAEDVSRNK